MSKKKIMKPKEYKELVNKLTNRVLEQEGITWEEGSTKYGMTRTKPRFQKLDYGYVKDREYMVNFSLWEHTIKNKNIMEVREMIFEGFPFLKGSPIPKIYKFDDEEVELSVSFWEFRSRGSLEIHGVVFGFIIRGEREEF
tara:strand:- start:35 stop:454 length:420 start_codon:yes stop_codon:yes gene_type:complete